ncbi:hypothetical protein LPJ66_004858 [Kickxella alabastrina]|uniref:Uncharacterized protein n=1 Tax=Kickxella alabastrina TaxID=61397 RepID=A0ACC1IG68_9FUNG|nr:hypothetical protein LPJ66_004858 [Kickxella alabastrina]
MVVFNSASTNEPTVPRTTNVLCQVCRALFKSKPKANSNNSGAAHTIYELQCGLVEESAAHYVAEATLDEAEGAISELTTEYANQYVACFVAENSRAETDAENVAFRAEMDALYTQLNESHRETPEIRRDTSAKLEKSEVFRAQEEARRIAAVCLCQYGRRGGKSGVCSQCRQCRAY